MPTAFPAALDSFTNPTAASSMNGVGVVHSVAHSNLNDAVVALQARIGVTGSADAASITNSLATKQATLVSGTNIKTINGQPVLGAGDIAISGGGGGSPTVRIASSTAIPLDTAGNGKAMPLTAGQTISITADITPTFTGAVEGGVCVADYLSSGTGNLVLTNALAKGDTFTAEAGRKYRATYAVIAGDVWAIVSKGALTDVTAPLLGTPYVADAAKSTIVVPITELNTPAINGSAAGVTLSGAAASGRTVASVAVVGGTLNIILSSPLAYGDVLDIAIAAGMVKDASNNLSVALATTAVTNNIALPLPGADTIAGGASTSTSQVVNVSTAGSNAATRKWQYKETASGTWLDAVTNALSTYTYTGLTAGTSYDYRTQTINATGNSASYSNVVTAITSNNTISDNFNAVDGTVVVGRTTTTGGQVWVAAPDFLSPKISGNKATSPGSYQSATALVPVSAIDGTLSADIAGEGALLMHSESDSYTCIQVGIFGGNMRVARRFTAGFRDLSLTPASGTKNVSMQMASGVLTVRMDGVVIYTGNPYAGDAYTRTPQARCGIHTEDVSHSVDNFVFTP